MPAFLDSVAFMSRPEARFLNLAAARRMKREYGARTHMYAVGPQEMAFYRTHGGEALFDTISDADVLLPNALAPVADREAVIERARAYEARLGTTFNTLALSNRHLGRGYALGGFHFPRSRYSQDSDYFQMLQAFNAELDFWLEEFESKATTLVVNGGKMLACAARMADIPFRTMVGARIGNDHFWAWNEFFENPAIEESFHAGEGADVGEIEAPYLSHMVMRQRFIRNANLLSLAKNLGWTTARQVYWRLRRYKKGRGYYYRDVLKHFVRSYTGYRKLRRIATTRLADLDGKSFVFYPLHLEPEHAFQTLSPEYFYQLSSIAAVSRDLPVGRFLAVKEHLNAIGSRPDNFYDQIADLKNVVMIDPTEFGLEIVRKAAATITVSGTAGFEAAAMGKPVIAFGRHNTYNFLPHVEAITDESRLRECLRAVFDGSIDLERAAADGRRFLESLAANSFDLGDHTHLNLHEFDEKALDDFFAMLIRSLKGTGDSAKARESIWTTGGLPSRLAAQ